jgi:hypothetical protein
VIIAPPLLVGGVNVTVARPLPARALTFVGAPGAVAGVTADDGALDALVPTLFVAATVNV